MNPATPAGLGVMLGIGILVAATLFTKSSSEYAPECMKDHSYNLPECRELRALQ